MRVTRLEIFGFKSFRDRFVLNFDRDLIGIIGPNGCGKSNVVDALRWVLGETHAKHLRGNVLDDLIFNGSDTHRPMGMAEVSITIRPDENWKTAEQLYSELDADLQRLESAVNASAKEISLEAGVEEEGQESAEVVTEEVNEKDPKEKIETGVFASSLADIPGLFDSAEIQLTRRLYRSGESEYFINKIPCRLRDMTELYRLIGLGARGLSIVQQGQIGEIISKKPLDRRELLEEAAGISGFRSKMEAAGRKLERTNTNMSRLSDIIQEVDKQVKNLKRQALKAKNRKQLKDELRDVELGLFNAKSARIIDRSERARYRRDQLAVDLDKFQANLGVFSARQLELRSFLEECDQKVIGLRRDRDSLSETLNFERNKEHRLELDIAKDEMRLTSLLGNKEGIEGRISELKLQIGTCEARVVEGETKKAEILNNIKQLEASMGVSESSSSAPDQENLDAESLNIEEQVQELITFSKKLGLEISRVQEVVSKKQQELNTIAGTLTSAGESSGLSSAEAKALAGSLQSAVAELAKLEAQLGQIESQIATQEVRRAESLKRYLQFCRLFGEDNQQYLEQTTKLAELKANFSTVEAGLKFEQRRVEELGSEITSLTTQAERIQSEHDSIKKAISSRRAELSDGATDKTEAEKSKYQQVEVKLSQVIVALDEEEKKRDAIRHELSDVADQHEAVRKSHEEVKDKIQSLTLTIEKSQIELTAVVDEIKRYYGENCSLPDKDKREQILQSLPEAVDQYLKDQQELAQSLRNRLEREGEVDPESIERFDSESERLEKMQVQLADLQNATKILERTIKHLKEISKERFLETFAVVSKTFSELVPRLFGGGAGRMELVNPEDPLTSGVELAVRPPGKNLRTMDLLSGGEKALAATAILMSMFLHRPSPICVLDEVDAPLDDANLSRFLMLIRDNSDKAQFLIITHNKVTMAAVDRLIGITMQEKGVTTALSVTFEETERELEKWAASARN